MLLILFWTNPILDLDAYAFVLYSQRDGPLDQNATAELSDALISKRSAWLRVLVWGCVAFLLLKTVGDIRRFRLYLGIALARRIEYCHRLLSMRGLPA